VEYLESLGFRVRIAPHAMNSAGYVSDTAENRAAAFHAMFRGPEVKTAVAMIGGDHSATSCHTSTSTSYGNIRRFSLVTRTSRY
jgi:muramoyltetrapeptide carboxypeptidase LdcA involved in peptidoglycan recycling